MTVSLGRTFIDLFTEYKRQRNTEKDGRSVSAGSVAGSATLVAGKGIGKLYGAMTKGALVNLLLALAEGIWNTLKLYGAEPDD